MAAVERRRLVFVGLVFAGATVALASCGRDDEPPNEGGTQSTSAPASSTAASEDSTDETGVPPPLEAPYGACAGELARPECLEVGPDVAQCLERDDPQGVPHSTCALACRDDGDCPAVGAGNVSPQCWGADDATPGLCLLDCNLGVNSCASGTICVDGDPPICMWPSVTPGHPDAQSFCDTACGPCGASLLLPWSGDCVAECLGDLADCSEPQLQEVFACTGGEACPVGGAVVAECLEPLACVMGTGR